jgi:hypothetical protein
MKKNSKIEFYISENITKQSMETKKILVTGGNGQLDKAFRNFQKISRI